MSETYAIVTPARNEAAFLPRVIASVAGQTVRPARWIILDDRSTDDSWAILQAAAREHDFITALRLEGAETGRAFGANVVRVFNQGYALIPPEVDFVVKMDADVLLPPDNFERLLAKFRERPRLGIGSGKTYIEAGGAWTLERIPDTHVTGACKVYRHACLKEMGGLIPILGWDILDVSKARMLGWETRSFPDLALRHLRMTGSSTGMAAAQTRFGLCYYGLRAHPLFVLLKALYRCLERPYGSGLFILWGFLKGRFVGQPRLDDRALVEWLRREQLGRALGRGLREERLIARRMEKEG
jgi:glycosyltransferase involved in cell wall biosynthesis